MAELKPVRKELVMRTQNPVHESDFTWTIDNASRLSRRIGSLKLESQCKPEFQLVAKFNERFPDVRVMNANFGVQRTDSANETIHVEVAMQLLSVHGDVYCHKVCDFKFTAGSAPYYCFSELFSDLAGGVKPPSFASNNTHNDMLPLRNKGLVGSHLDTHRIFLLPNDTLVVKGTIKTFGCCILTSSLPLADAAEESPPKSLIEEMLEDLREAYQNDTLTDIQLKVGSGVIRAHKFVLVARSPVFRRMFEHDTKEKSEGTIDIVDLEQPILEALVWYLYTGEVRKLSFDETCDLYKAADMYEVFVLRQACADVLKVLLDQNTACRTLEMADLHGDADLRGVVKDFIVGNFSKFKDSEEWEFLLRHHYHLASEVLQKLSDNLPPPPPRREVLFLRPE